MTPQQIINELQSRGEYSIQFDSLGMIYSKHGKHTFNTWVIKDGKLLCVDCKTKY